MLQLCTLAFGCRLVPEELAACGRISLNIFHHPSEGNLC